MDPCTAVRASVMLASLCFGLAVFGIVDLVLSRVYSFRVQGLGFRVPGSTDFSSSHLSPDTVVPRMRGFLRISISKPVVMPRLNE